MKYGQTFRAQSVPQWAPYNVDYNELKNLIKVHTTKDQGQAIAIPGQTDTSLAKFEELFFNELYNQHDRVDLFVRSKADEISRRLASLQTQVLRLLSRCTYNNGKPMSQKRRDKFAKYDGQIMRCGEDTKALQRFVGAQRMAFHKILKKYKKWTGSGALGERFNAEVLGSPKSFTRRDFEPLLSLYNDLLVNLRASTPDASLPTTPRSQRSRRSSAQLVVQHARQSYWNEYDDGSEAENEPYTIYVNPDAESTFPGSKTFVHIFSSVKVPMQKIKGWLSPTASSPSEQRPLFGNGNMNGNGNNGYFNEQTETDLEDEAYASSSDFPSGYATHYATFPSIHDQKLSQGRETLLFYGTITSFAAATVFFLIASLLVATGKHKLRVEVDVGAIIGVVASFFFATLGLGTMLYRTESLGWLHKSLVVVVFTGICLLNGMLLVLIVGNSGL